MHLYSKNYRFSHGRHSDYHPPRHISGGPQVGGHLRLTGILAKCSSVRANRMQACRKMLRMPDTVEVLRGRDHSRNFDRAKSIAQ